MRPGRGDLQPPQFFSFLVCFGASVWLLSLPLYRLVLFIFVGFSFVSRFNGVFHVFRPEQLHLLPTGGQRLLGAAANVGFKPEKPYTVQFNKRFFLSRPHSSLQEKPPSVDVAGASPESQSFIKQPSSSAKQLATASKDLDYSQLGDDELIVREEKRVSISWSRDASPAPLMSSSVTTSSSTNKSASPEQAALLSASMDSNVEREIAQGARKKSSTPLKSSQSEESQETVIERARVEEEQVERAPPTKAQLHQLAQAPTEPRKK